MQNISDENSSESNCKNRLDEIIAQCESLLLDQLEQTSTDIGVLQNYIRSVGKRIPDKILNDLGTLNQYYKIEKDISKTLILSLSIHGALSEQIYPVTIRSIKATDPDQSLYDLFKQNWSIFVIFWLTLLSGLSVVIAKNFSGCILLFTIPTNVIASMAGAAFYSLFTAYGFISNRTFEPKYNFVYFVRFVLGVVSGSLLSSLDLVKDLGDYSPTVLGVIGGYSAEAVNQILLRVSDVLITLVKGNPKEDFSQQAATLRAEAKSEKIRQQHRTATELNNLLKSAMGANAPEQTINDIKATIDSLSK